MTPYNQLEPGALHWRDLRQSAPCVKIDADHSIAMGGCYSAGVYLYPVWYYGTTLKASTCSPVEQMAGDAFKALQAGRLSPNSDWKYWDEIVAVRPELALREAA